MNYLAHAFLSPRDPQVLLGNLAGDSIRKVNVEALPSGIRRGISLHEQIDAATDTDQAFQELRSNIYRAGLPYAGVLADLMIDYALGAGWKHFSHEEFPDFKSRIYATLGDAEGQISERFSFTATVLIMEDWFESYRSLEGMRTAFFRLNRKTRRSLPVRDIMSFMETQQSQILRLGETVLERVSENIVFP